MHLRRLTKLELIRRAKLPQKKLVPLSYLCADDYNHHIPPDFVVDEDGSTERHGNQPPSPPDYKGVDGP